MKVIRIPYAVEVGLLALDTSTTIRVMMQIISASHIVRHQEFAFLSM